MKVGIETIRKVITKNRGGLEAATDGQIKIIWDSLNTETQEKYLSTVKVPADKKERKPKDAFSDKPERTI